MHPNGSGPYRRVLNAEYAAALRAAREAIR
jgi:hypothetical protein